MLKGFGGDKELESSAVCWSGPKGLLWEESSGEQQSDRATETLLGSRHRFSLAFIGGAFPENAHKNIPLSLFSSFNTSFLCAKVVCVDFSLNMVSTVSSFPME